MFRAETQQTLLHRFDTEHEPFVLQCLSSAAPCQLEFAVRMGEYRQAIPESKQVSLQVFRSALAPEPMLHRWSWRCSAATQTSPGISCGWERTALRKSLGSHKW